MRVGWLLLSICLIWPVACAFEEPLEIEDEEQGAIFVTEQEGRGVFTKFVTVDEQGHLIDSRDGKRLKRKEPEEVVSEKSLVNTEVEAATNQLRMRFKETTDALKPVAGRPVKLRKPKAALPPRAN